MKVSCPERDTIQEDPETREINNIPITLKNWYHVHFDEGVGTLEFALPFGL